MITVGIELARLLSSSAERIRISRELGNTTRESIRRTHKAILHSQETMGRSDRVMHNLTPSADKPETASRPLGDPANLMERVLEQTISDQVLNMDGKHFIDCEIRRCVLEYSGQPLVMESTHFSDCSFCFKGEAALTMRFLECFGIAGQSDVHYTVAPAVSPASPRPN